MVFWRSQRTSNRTRDHQAFLILPLALTLLLAAVPRLSAQSPNGNDALPPWQRPPASQSATSNGQPRAGDPTVARPPAVRQANYQADSAGPAPKSILQSAPTASPDGRGSEHEMNIGPENGPPPYSGEYGVGCGCDGGGAGAGGCGNGSCGSSPCGGCGCGSGPCGDDWFGSCTCLQNRLELRGEYLLWWTKGSQVPALVTTSPSDTSRENAGVLGQAGTSILFGDSELNGETRSGGRFTRPTIGSAAIGASELKPAICSSATTPTDFKPAATARRFSPGRSSIPKPAFRTRA